MTNISEDYVSFETAKLLKEKGFDEQIRDFYRYENNIWIHRNTYEHNHFNLGIPRWENCYSCPTLQMATKWLREEHNIFISIVFCTYPSLNKVTWTPEISTFDSVFPESAIEYDSYEEATEAAIKYCLENLI